MSRDAGIEDDGPAEAADSRSVRSIVAGFGLIRALEAHPGPMPLKDLAAAAGMAPSRAHAHLVSFRAVGLVMQEAGGERYALGPYALKLGLAALGRLDVREAAREPMRLFRESTGEAIHLSVWSGSAPVIVARVDGSHPVPLTIKLGFALPLGSSASGRIFLAFLPGSEKQLPSRGLSAELRGVVEDTRRQRLARTDSLVYAGTVAVSAPIFDHEGVLAAALTALGSAGVLDTGPEGEVAQALAGAAAAASAAMGYGQEAAAPAGPAVPKRGSRRAG
ncbi:IclR family transcriptional regulator [Roseomonas sp. BN140053]|uniref:IclR family transcriptional regulator n=1 Tax=Roseomonas sp. BN140053 TaxID=3391898 RepID=UPI0039E92CDA